MTTYANGKIYAVKSPNTELIYIGSTKEDLEDRFKNHLSKFNRSYSKTIINYGNAFIELIEEYPCKNRAELEKREGYYQKLYNEKCINKYIAGGKDMTEELKQQQKSYLKAYREKNKKELLEYRRQYYQLNKEKQKQQAQEYKLKNQEREKERAKKYYQNKKITNICRTIITDIINKI